jgi:hypothetical protein
MSTSFTDPSGLGSLDSGDPCDITSLAYDPTACAASGGATTGVGTPVGTTGPSLPGDPCDPTQSSYDPVICASQTSPGGVLNGSYAPGVDVTTISWCEANPGACDTNGPTGIFISQFCQENPAECNINSDGTETVIGSGETSPSTGAGGTGVPGSGGTLPKVGVNTGGSGGIIGGLGNILNSLGSIFSTCPAGYIKLSNGNCVKAGTVPPQNASILGFNSGSLLMVAVLIGALVILKKKGQG